MLMLDIFNGGNFGRGDGERVTQNLSVYSTEMQLTDGSSVIGLLRGLNREAVQRYPRLMKHGIMHPFGWIILGVRYVFRVLTGRRKKVPTGTMKMIALRKDLYQKLEVFDRE